MHRQAVPSMAVSPRSPVRRRGPEASSMESLEQKLRQLDQDREEADQRYNEALTALDRALPRPPDLPSPAPALDDSQLPSINSSWDIAATSPAVPGGWRGRLAGVVWRTVAPYLQQQSAFNSR